MKMVNAQTWGKNVCLVKLVKLSQGLAGITDGLEVAHFENKKNTTLFGSFEIIDSIF